MDQTIDHNNKINLHDKYRFTAYMYVCSIDWCNWELKLKDEDSLIGFHLMKVKFNREDRTNDINTRSFQYLNLRHSYFWSRRLPAHARMLFNGSTWKENLLMLLNKTFQQLAFQ